jgi:hypothetical protein
MSILGNPSKDITIYVKRGENFTTSFSINNPDGTPVTLTGTTFTADVRKTKTSPTVEASFTFSISGTEVTMTLPTSETDPMVSGDNDTDEASKYVYDVMWTYSGQTYRIFGGALIFSETVTRS